MADVVRLLCQPRFKRGISGEDRATAWCQKISAMSFASRLASQRHENQLENHSERSTN